MQKQPGGLKVKPTHISINLFFKNKRRNYVYGNTGFIHFDAGTDNRAAN
jgi:hypothetical protein